LVAQPSLSSLEHYNTDSFPLQTDISELLFVAFQSVISGRLLQNRNRNRNDDRLISSFRLHDSNLAKAREHKATHISERRQIKNRL